MALQSHLPECRIPVAPMACLFVEQLTVLDFSRLDRERGLVGERTQLSQSRKPADRPGCRSPGAAGG